MCRAAQQLDTRWCDAELPREHFDDGLVGSAIGRRRRRSQLQVSVPDVAYLVLAGSWLYAHGNDEVCANPATARLFR